VVGDICGVGHPARIDARTAQAAGAGTRAIDSGSTADNVSGSTADNVSGSAADNYGDCDGGGYREAQRHHHQARDCRRKA
jgi:hypothetical protein